MLICDASTGHEIQKPAKNPKGCCRAILKLGMRIFIKLLLGAVLINGGMPPVFAQSSAFTYQGSLNDGVNPANGIYDLQFTLYTSPTGSGAYNPVVSPATVVSNGLFTVLLDFSASAFSGADRWLQIGVRTNGSVAAYTQLSPRQPVTPTPYALRASVAATVPSGAITSGMIAGGAITSDKLATGAVVSSLAAEDLGTVPTSQAVVMSTLAADEALTSRGYTRMGNPATLGLESWTPVPVPGVGNTPIPGAIHSVWTGTELLILSYFGEGARYNPVSGNWFRCQAHRPIGASGAKMQAWFGPAPK